MYDQIVKEIEANEKKTALENPTPVPAEPAAEPTPAAEPVASEPAPAAEPAPADAAPKAWYEDVESDSNEPKPNDPQVLKLLQMTKTRISH